jgi:hypothetical protein
VIGRDLEDPDQEIQRPLGVAEHALKKVGRVHQQTRVRRGRKLAQAPVLRDLAIGVPERALFAVADRGGM